MLTFILVFSRLYLSNGQAIGMVVVRPTLKVTENQYGRVDYPSDSWASCSTLFCFRVTKLYGTDRQKFVYKHIITICVFNATEFKETKIH